MKKILTIALTAVLALSLVACGGGIKDGTYTAEGAEASHDWFDTLSVTYKDGKVVAIVSKDHYQYTSSSSKTIRLIISGGGINVK
ncbi:MAG: hypothetical protein RR989_02040, partial [Ruthenibacterium sp.]